MKFCDTHWQKLRAAIEERGMGGLIAKSGQQAAAQLVAQTADGVAKTNFDPLMAAHNAIVSRALDTVGLALMMQNDDGSDRCPLCFCQTSHDADCKQGGCSWRVDDAWIPGCCDAMLAEAKRLNLVGAS